MKNEMKAKMVTDVINFLSNEGLNHIDKRKVLSSAYGQMTKAIKAGTTGEPEEEIEVEKSDSNCPKKNETIEFED